MTHAETLVDAISQLHGVETEVRQRVGTRRAYTATAVLVLIAAHNDAGILYPYAGNNYSFGVGRLLYELPSSMREPIESLDILPVLEDLHRSGLFSEVVGRILGIVKSIPDAMRENLADLYIRSGGAFMGDVFITPMEIARLASKIALGGHAERDQKFSAAGDIKILDPRIGYSEMVLALLHELRHVDSSIHVTGYESSADAVAISKIALSVKEGVTHNLTYGDWLISHGNQSASFDYLMSAIPITSWRFLEREIHMRFPAFPRSTDSTLLYVWKVAHDVMAAPGSRAVLVVNPGAFVTGAATSGDAYLRSKIVATGTLRAMVMLPSGTYEGTGLAPCLLLLSREPEGVQTKDGFILVDARKLGAVGYRRRRILSDEEANRISRAVTAGDEELSLSVTYEKCASSEAFVLPPFGIISVDGKARPNTLDPLDNEVRLGDICEAMQGRNRVGKGEDQEPEYRVVRAEDIGVELAPWQDLPVSTKQKSSSIAIQPGDIIGSISQPYGRWVIVPPGYGSAFASDHTVILRMKAGGSAWYVLAFLRSDKGKRLIKTCLTGSVIQRINYRQLIQIPIPVVNADADYVDEVYRGYDSQLKRLESEIGHLRERIDYIYQAESILDAEARIDALNGVTAAVSSISDLGGSLSIAKNAFPYPIARSLRAIDRSISERERYHLIAHESLEAISNVLTAICAATARQRSIKERPIKNWANSIERNGATIGGQLAMIYRVAQCLIAGSVTSDVGGLGRALGDTNSAGVKQLNDMLVERNRIHGDYPRSDFQFRQRLQVVENFLEELLDALSFLARWELRYSESVEPMEDDSGNVAYRGDFRVLRGDNPDWASIEYISPRPIYRGRIYAFVDNRELLDMHPFLVARDCPLCGNLEIYHPDSYSIDGVKLKSIDRGHSQLSTEEQLLRDLGAALAKLI